MVIVGIDPHKRTHTAVAIDARTGEALGEPTVAARPRGHERLVRWALRLGGDLRVAVEDCRHVSGGLERLLLERGVHVVRVPPKLMGQARGRTRTRGKSDAIDALAVARAALANPGLPVASLAGPEREIRLLVCRGWCAHRRGQRSPRSPRGPTLRSARSVQKVWRTTCAPPMPAPLNPTARGTTTWCTRPAWPTSPACQACRGSRVERRLRSGLPCLTVPSRC